MTDAINTNERLILVNVSIHQWYPRKFDRKASDELAQLHGAKNADEIGRFNKILVELDSIKPLQTALRELRERHYEMTAPWSDKGQRVLPVELYFEYVGMVTDKIAEIDKLADTFVYQEYEAQRDAARTRLNGLFDEDDYPASSEVRSRFGVDYRFSPLPNPEDARVYGIGQQAADEIARDVEASVRAGIEKSQRAVVERVVTAAQDFIARVTAFSDKERQEVRGNALRETALTNMLDVVSLVIEGLNVTADQQLEKLAKELRGLFDDVNIQQLKVSQGLRDKKVNEVEATLDKFAGVFK